VNTAVPLAGVTIPCGAVGATIPAPPVVLVADGVLLIAPLAPALPWP
jgi:hypothetical protein